MLEVILAGNPEAGRLEAEIRNERYDLVAIVYEDHAGWHIEKHRSDIIPDDLLQKIKDEFGMRPNRKGDQQPEGLTVGEYSLWLLEKDEISK